MYADRGENTPMVSKEDRNRIAQVARKYGVARMLLFGSNVDPQHEGRDIDLAVEGIAPSMFFTLYRDLIFALSKPVDLIDLADDTPFAEIVRREGVPIYG